jgi:hypothetical protein
MASSGDWIVVMRRLTNIVHRGSALLFLLGGIGSATAASAAEPDAAVLGTGYTAGDAPLGAPTELRIELSGTVAPRCRMTSAPALAGQPDLTHRGEMRAQFGIDCNTPFRLRVRSGEGGFSAQDRHDGNARLIPYEIAVAVDTDSGANALGWCAADQLADQSGSCAFGSREGWSSGDATAINRSGAVQLRWAAPREAGALPLGRYRDTIVVELAVRS